MKDLVIIGGGPAAITAAIYACRQSIDFKIITDSIGGQAAYSSQVENYTGFEVISGAELIAKFLRHADEFGVEMKDGFRVDRIEDSGGEFRIFTADGECCSARALVIATGSRPRRLGVPGESDFINKGLAYCATCDAPLFRGKTVAVIGGGNSALDAARQLKELAEKVYIITIGSKLGGEKIVRDKIIKSDNVEVLECTAVTAVTGEKMVSGIEFETLGGIKRLDVEGVFVEIGWQPSSGFIDFVEKNEKGEIIVDINNQTSRKAVYAAGDVTNVSKKQIIIAAGSGAAAALNAIDFIARTDY